MVYVNIPYVVENDRIDRALTARELELLDIDEAAKHEAFEAIYHKRPRGVSFSSIDDAVQLQRVLYRLGVPYRQTPESDYKYEDLPNPA
jgi:hypothetical protein